MRRRLLLLALLLPVIPAAADEVTLKNGDRITGTVVDLAGGMLQVATQHSGPLKVKWTEVETLKTDGAVRVLLTSGEEHEGVLSMEGGGPLRVQAEGAPEPVDVPPEDVTHFNKPRVTWHGSLIASGRKTDGNTHTTSFLGTGELTRHSDVDDILLKGTYSYAEDGGDVTERNMYGQGKYNYRFWDGLYVFVSEELLSDRFKNLTVRSITSVGVGYDFLTEDWITFSGEAGVAYVYNNFRDELLEEDDGYLGGRAAAILAMKLPLGLEVKDTFTYYPNFEDTADWQIRNEAALEKAVGPFLGGMWTLSGGVITEIDNEPPAGNEEHDNTYYVGLGFKF